MSLMLTICSAPASSSVPESNKTFDAAGGTLGRGKENTWVLDDPERYLSSLHCQISSEGGQYYLTDLSTNGTFFNGSSEPMGKGRKLPLNDGDKFSMGDYEFSVNLWGAASNQPSSMAEPMQSVTDGGSQFDDFLGQDPFSSNNDFDQSFGGGANPFETGYVPQSDSLFSVDQEETDPLAALDKVSGTPSSSPSGFDSPFSDTSYSDQADPMNQQISWPESSLDTAGGIIPDDWDDDLGPNRPVPAPVPKIEQSTASAPIPESMPPPPELPTPGKKSADSQAPAPVSIPNEGEVTPKVPENTISKSQLAEIQKKALEKANAKVAAEVKKLKQQLQQRKANSDSSIDTTLVESLGFQVDSLSDEQIAEINKKAGEVIRESVKGLMQVLSSRSAIKNEFRMNVTTIQPIENNPLKFSANVDDALENMFLKQGNAYKKPIDAVQEGFSGIAEHQVAIIAGIRAAFKSVITRFDPIGLEERFSKGSSKVALIPGVQKAKNWDLYSDYYTDLVGDLDNSFQYLFGDEFVQAYEDQLRKLALAKKEQAKG